MTSFTRTFALGSFLALVPALAYASTQVVYFLGYFKEVHVASGDATATVGAKQGSGFQLKPGIVPTPIAGQAHPLCISWHQYLPTATRGNGWVGVGLSQTVGNSTVLRCMTHQSGIQDLGSWVFRNEQQRSTIWMRSVASTPEPRGAIRLAVQQISNRPLYACSFQKSGTDYVGYIGDDGVCYGSSVAGVKGSDSGYLVLVSSATGTAAQPRYEWMPASATYLPHPHASLGQLTAKANINGVVMTNPPKKTLCKVLDGSSTWPGYLEGNAGANGTCRYFTYYNNQTQVKTSTKYSVRRVDPAAPKSRYVFGNHAGQSFYACVGANNMNNIVWGFSNNLTGCTNGTTTVSQNVVYAELPADPPSGA